MIDYKYERELTGINTYVYSTDEVACGCLVGPVYAAAIYIPEEPSIKGINDSKKLSEARREALFIEIGNKYKYAIGQCSVEEIDQLNIYWAKLEAMRRAINSLSSIINHEPELILIDGNAEIPNIKYPQKTIIKGDGKVISIAAASIMAKVSRDRYIVKLGEQYPEYNFNINKGYWSKEHVEAIKKTGYIKGLHRRVFLENILGKRHWEK